MNKQELIADIVPLVLNSLEHASINVQVGIQHKLGNVLLFVMFCTLKPTFQNTGGLFVSTLLYKVFLFRGADVSALKRLTYFKFYSNLY